MRQGLTLILIPRDYLGFWAGNASELIAKVKPNLLARPQIIRLLGLVELSIGMGCVAMRLGSREKPAFRQNIKSYYQRRKSQRRLSKMFVNIIYFPPIKPDQEAAFREWFEWSNQEYAKHKGFISRKLLKPHEGGNYVGLVEHESYETFMAMHTSQTQAEANKRVKPFFDGSPTPGFLEVVLE